MDKKRYEEGLAVRKAVLGAEQVEKSLRAADEFTPPMQELVTEYCWGEIWTRPGLDRKTRSFLNLAMLTALKPSARNQAACARGAEQRPDQGRVDGGLSAERHLLRGSRRT